jgi:hypothetical protein
LSTWLRAAGQLNSMLDFFRDARNQSQLLDR